MRTPGTQPATPNIEEIEQYLQGTLPALRSHEIELLAMEDPMLADALEGYATVPAFDAVQELQFTSPRHTGGTPWWHFAGWIGGLGLGVALAVWLIPSEDKPNIESPNTSSIVQTPTVPDHKDLADKTNTQIDSQTSLLETKEDKSNFRNLDTSSNSNPVESNLPFLRYDQTDEIKVIERKSILPVLLDIEKKDPALKEQKTPGGADITHFRNYKLVDYTILRSPKWEDFSLDNEHIHPDKANEHESNDEVSAKIVVSIPYINYLEKCISAYSSSDYSSSASHFDVILNQYPTDLNAQFYGAMSYYQMSDYEKAIERFDMSSKNVFKVFREESEFYKAMSLQKIGRTEEANDLFNKIASSNGYYSKRALLEKK
ncbi:MAG: tetratricopeptide repeat protein [Flavobacteriales bacterium]|nr:tetratricopeptide repeat protein [Flavobacteriales bacterium]